MHICTYMLAPGYIVGLVRSGSCLVPAVEQPDQRDVCLTHVIPLADMSCSACCVCLTHAAAASDQGKEDDTVASSCRPQLSPSAAPEVTAAVTVVVTLGMTDCAAAGGLGLRPRLLGEREGGEQSCCPAPSASNPPDRHRQTAAPRHVPPHSTLKLCLLCWV